MLWSVTNTRDNERSPLYMSRVLARWHRADARLRLVFARHGPRVGLFLEAPTAMQPLIEKQLAGEYKDVDLLRLPDDALGPSNAHVTWHRELVLRPHVFPIERFTQQVDGATRTFSDPLPGILEACTTEDDLDAHVGIDIRPATTKAGERTPTDCRDARPYLFPHASAPVAPLCPTSDPPVMDRPLCRPARFITCRLGPLPVDVSDLAMSPSRTHEREHDLQAAIDKAGSHLFVTTLRLSVSADAANRAPALAKLEELTAVISATAIPRLATFHATPIRRDDHRQRRPTTMLLSADEIASLWHPATASVAAAGLRASEVRKPEPPDDLPDPREPGVVQIGKMLFRDRGREVWHPKFGCSASRVPHGKDGLRQDDLHAFDAGKRHPAGDWDCPARSGRGPVRQSPRCRSPRPHRPRCVVRPGRSGPPDGLQPTGHSPRAAAGASGRQRLGRLQAPVPRIVGTADGIDLS